MAEEKEQLNIRVPGDCLAKIRHLVTIGEGKSQTDIVLKALDEYFGKHVLTEDKADEQRRKAAKSAVAAQEALRHWLTELDEADEQSRLTAQTMVDLARKDVTEKQANLKKVISLLNTQVYRGD